MKEKLLRCKDCIWSRDWLRETLSGLCLFLTLVGLDGGLRLIYRGDRKSTRLNSSHRW